MSESVSLEYRFWDAFVCSCFMFVLEVLKLMYLKHSIDCFFFQCSFSISEMLPVCHSPGAFHDGR